MDSKLGLQGPAVLIEQIQTATQLLVFRPSLTDNAIPALRPRPPTPAPQVLTLFSFSGSSFGGGPFPRKMSLAVCSCKGGGGLRRRNTSCLIPLPPRKGFNPSPAVPVRGPVLKGGLRVHPTCQPSASCWCRLQGWGCRLDW